ncbi:MAG: stalk domain-containing protein [Bacillota bacterium]|nr:stalk domain-containing protein [Bacillota bacterium]
MPDGIAAFSCRGRTYIVTANEGDSREWGDYLNEAEINFGKGKASPTGNITPENSGLTGKVVFFDTGDYDGLDAEKDYLFGGRSFTVFETGEDGIEEVYDSADDFERITSEMLPEYFNCSNDDITIDDRSGKKGPEPESVITRTVDGRTYAFIALERIGGIMAYDITDPEKISYAGYINSREFTDDMAGDVAPEGLEFVPASKNPYGRNLLLAACEVSGTAAVYALGKVPEKVTSTGSSSVSRYTVRFDPDGAGSIPSQTVRKNGKTEYSDAAPFIRNDRTMTPARFVAEALGAQVLWNEAERTVTVAKDGIEIVLTINSDTAVVNGNNVRLDSPAVIENNRTYTPARFIGETLGAKVEWDAETRRVIITK